MKKMIMLFAIIASLPVMANAACLDNSTIDIGNHVYTVDNGNTTLNMTQMINDMEALCNNQAMIATILDAMNIRISSLQNQTYGNYTWMYSSVSNTTSSISTILENVTRIYGNLSVRVSSLEQSTNPSIQDIAALNASVIYINAINAAQTANMTNLTSTVNALPNQEDNTMWFMIGLGAVMLSVIGLFAYVMVNKGGSESSG